MRQFSEPFSVDRTSSLENGGRIVDDRHASPPCQTDRLLEREPAQVGVAYGVEYQLMWWKRDGTVQKISNDNACHKNAVVKKEIGRDISVA